MQYIRSMTLPDGEGEFLAIAQDAKKGAMTCYGSKYPFGIFPEIDLSRIDFAPITIFCGGNGSGKSTLLNVIAEHLRLSRTAPFNQTPYFTEYVRACEITCEEETPLPRESRIITSDDVFQSLLRRRAAHAAIDAEREHLIDDYYAERKREHVQLTSLDDYDRVKRHNDAWKKTPSRYVNDRLSRAEDGASNGESAYRYFTESIRGDALYLLDEPENSLSPMLVQRLSDFLTESARYFGCQLVIATHSPLLLALPGAKIYDLDARPAAVRPWQEIDSIRMLYDFFRMHDSEFEK